MKKLIAGLSIGIFGSLIVSHVYAAGLFDAKSWRDVDVDKYNKLIKAAYSKNQEWVSKPELYAHYLLGLGETKQVLYSIEANAMESPSEYTIKLKRDAG